jgi:hypothetical protein
VQVGNQVIIIIKYTFYIDYQEVARQATRPYLDQMFSGNHKHLSKFSAVSDIDYRRFKHKIPYLIALGRRCSRASGLVKQAINGSQTNRIIGILWQEGQSRLPVLEGEELCTLDLA